MKRTRITFVAASLAGALTLAPAGFTAFAQEELPAETAATTGEAYFLNSARTHYVPERDLVDKAFEELPSDLRERSVKVSDAAAAGLVEAGQEAERDAERPTREVTEEGKPMEVPFSADDVDPDSPHPVAAGLVALPSVVALEGKTYYLNADGETYVDSIDRIDKEPTQEEKDNTNRLLSDNGAEVGRQALAEAKAGGKENTAGGGLVGVSKTAGDAHDMPQVQAPVAAAASERGMSAQTGDNTVPRALAALLVASVLGAAFYAYGRRWLA
ncbi:hypothetical protein [Corynebacterium mayonis]|uniref:hypothetical protein n=1 Tax=Corynebacterium mayonis TaxID=3062461 RepID=UPI003140619D